MSPLRYGAAAAFALILSVPCHAQSPRLQFDHLTVDDGLSNPWVQSILEDSRGFLWFGTQDGLNRYDGGSIKIYRHDPQDPNSLPSSVVGVLFEDSKKRLWIGSGWGGRGVALYDRAHDRFRTFLLGSEATDRNHVRSIIEDRQGQIWLGTNGGVARIDAETGVIQRFPPTPDGYLIVLSLHEDRKGRLWVGTDAGLFQLDRTSGRYERWPGSTGSPTGLSSSEIWDLYGDDEGGLWVATLGGGLHRLDLTTGSETRYLPNPHDPNSINSDRVRRLVPDGGGRLYVGTESGGLNVLDLRTRKFRHEVARPEDETSLRSSSIWSLHLDDQGILWIGTYNGGVDRVSPSSQRFEHVRARRSCLNDSHVNSVMEDHLGNLWIGTDEGGLNRLDRKTGTCTYYRHDPKDKTTIGSNSVWALFEDKQRNVWVGGWHGGLGRLDPATGRVTRFRHDPNNPTSIADDRVWRILELRTGELLVVTHTGADLLDRRTGFFTHLSGSERGAGEVLFSAAEDRDGNLWLVGSAFVGHIDRRTGQTRRYRHDPEDPNSLGSGMTQTVHVDSAGNVWLGTEGGLSCLVASTQEMRRYTTADGLPNNTIATTQEDDQGNLWLGTNRGLSKFVNAVHVPGKPTFVNFDVHDGLQGNEFARNASCRGRSGGLFFGGSQGLSLFNPGRVERNPHVPPIVLTDLRLFNRSAKIGAPGSPLERTITETSELTLSHRHTMVTFEFAALNFVVPQKNQYSYKLEGFDKAWNEVDTQHSATYTNLPQGTFTLRVRGSNNDGVWNDEGVSLRIHVTPPFWKTRWFLAAVALMLVGAAAGAYWLRVRQHIRAERALQERVSAALADVKTLRGLLPICAWCKKVRDDGGYWSRIEEYISEHSDAEFSHGICPECRERRFQRPSADEAKG